MRVGDETSRAHQSPPRARWRRACGEYLIEQTIATALCVHHPLPPAKLAAGAALKLATALTLATALMRRSSAQLGGRLVEPEGAHDRSLRLEECMHGGGMRGDMGGGMRGGMGGGRQLAPRRRPLAARAL